MCLRVDMCLQSNIFNENFHWTQAATIFLSLVSLNSIFRKSILKHRHFVGKFWQKEQMPILVLNAMHYFFFLKNKKLGKLKEMGIIATIEFREKLTVALKTLFYEIILYIFYEKRKKKLIFKIFHKSTIKIFL